MTVRPATNPQPLSLEDWALLRAWAEGLPLGAAWGRYRPESSTESAPAGMRRAALHALLARARAQAGQAGRPDLAALLRRDPLAMALPAPDVPTLEAFRELQPADFYSESELLALYAQTHGAAARRARPEQRRARLRARLVEALQWLQAHAPALRAPQLADPVGLWLPPPTAHRLVQAGLTTLGDVQGWIARQGYHWPRGIARLGRVRADRLLSWWQAQAGTLPALPAQALVSPADQRRQAAQAAHAARHRADPGLLRTQAPGSLAVLTERQVDPADRQALQQWLATLTGSGHTVRAYRREVERLLLWCAMVRERPAGALNPADAQDFLGWLAQPPSAWCAPRCTPRWAAEWRPQEAGLGRSGLRLARSALRAWFAHRIEAGLNRQNPWLAVTLPQPLAAATASAQGVGPSNRSLETATGASALQAPTHPENPHTSASDRPLPADALRQPGPAAWGTSPRPARHQPDWRPADWSAVRAWWSQRQAGPRHARVACLLALVDRLGLRPAELARARWWSPNGPPMAGPGHNMAWAPQPRVAAAQRQPVAAQGLREGRQVRSALAAQQRGAHARLAISLRLPALRRTRRRWPPSVRPLDRGDAHEPVDVFLDAAGLPPEVARYATSLGQRAGDGLLQRLDGRGPIGQAQIYALLRRTVQAYRVEQRF